MFTLCYVDEFHWKKIKFPRKYSEKKAIYLYIIIWATVTDKIFNISSYKFSITFLFDRLYLNICIIKHLRRGPIGTCLK